jgi:hypothetical protein
MTSQQAAFGTTKAQSSFAATALFIAWSFRLQVLLICAGAGFLSVILGPDNNWDLRFYHLYAPWAYLHGRYLYDIGPAQYQGFFNPTADFLFYALTSSRLNDYPRIVAFIMGAMHGINAALIFTIALHVIRPLQRLESLTLRAVAVVIGMSGAGFISLLGGTTNDLINSIFVLASLLSILKLADRPSGPETWIGFAWSGLWLGIAVGLKYTAIIFVPGLVLIALITALRRNSARGLITFGIASMLGFLVVAGHHLLVLWRDFGNPVFPLFNNIFQSPYYDPISIRDDQFLPRGFWQAVAYPFFWASINSDLVSELQFRDWRGAITYIAIVTGLLALATAFVRQKHVRHGVFAQTHGLGLIFIFVTTSHFIWEFSFSIYRYAVALEMLSGIVAIGTLIWLVADRHLRIVAALALLITAAATTVYLDWGRGEYSERYVDVSVPQLPLNSVVLVASWDPAAYFIPFAEPTAQYLGIENNYLQLSQNNRLASEVKRLMRTPGRLKFVLSVGELDSKQLSILLGEFGLRLSSLPCRPIWSNLEVQALSVCAVVAD